MIFQMSFVVKNNIIWSVMPCSLVGACFLLLTCSSYSSHFYQTTRHHAPQGSVLHAYHCANLVLSGDMVTSSCKVSVVLVSVHYALQILMYGRHANSVSYQMSLQINCVAAVASFILCQLLHIILYWY
jgi:hypothetical protein